MSSSCTKQTSDCDGFINESVFYYNNYYNRFFRLFSCLIDASRSECFMTSLKAIRQRRANELSSSTDDATSNVKNVLTIKDEKNKVKVMRL